MDPWPITVQARRSLLSTFEELDDAQWEAESLCDGWTIRQVLAHLILAARPPARRYIAAAARAKGNFDEANAPPVTCWRATGRSSTTASRLRAGPERRP